MNKFDFTCPNCGSEFTVIENNGVKAKERIEALRAAGVDVSNMFAMQGANGGEHVGTIIDGRLSILDENDPIFMKIMECGTVPNRKLFRRWVTRQVFEQLLMVERGRYYSNVNQVIASKGYEYQWKMLLDELHVQTKLSGDELMERNVWFNKDVCVAMAFDYINKLNLAYKSVTVRYCKGVPYKHIGGKQIFVVDFAQKVLPKLTCLASHIKMCDSHNIVRLYNAVQKFNDARLKMRWDTKMCTQWVDAYKGAGAYFTMQNLIRFGNCFLKSELTREFLNKRESLELLQDKAFKNSNRGWWLYGMMKDMLNYNNINLQERINSWRKK